MAALINIRVRRESASSIVFPDFLYRHKHDVELNDLRDPTEIAGTPEVFVLYDYSIPLTQQWQYFCRAANMGMTPAKVAALFGDRKAFCNRMGLGEPSDPRADWLNEENTGREDPKLSKAYTCGGSLLAGEPEGNYLWVRHFDGNQPPPLKPGKAYPLRVEDIDPDDYVYHPSNAPWMFLVAVNVTDKGSPFPFNNGGLYSWTPEPSRPFTFLPHVSRRQVLYPLAKLERVTEWVSPYWIP